MKLLNNGLFMANKRKIDVSGKLVLIVGPSGVGKGSVIKRLKKDHPEYIFPISATTRQIRPGERDGETYHFVSRSQFEDMLDEGKLLEHAIVHDKEYYGTLKEPIVAALSEGEVVIREVDMQGCESIQKAVKKEDLVTIFITVPDKNDLVQRILHRGKLPEEEIKRRMESAEREFAKGGEVCDYQVPNLDGKLDECVKEVGEIIEKETSK